jgi:hypothetical protein
MYPFNFTAGSWAAVVIYFIVSFFAMFFSVVDVIVGEIRDKREALKQDTAGRS